jgi:hypothetical protein
MMIVEQWISILPLEEILRSAGIVGILLIIFEMQTMSALMHWRGQRRAVLDWFTRAAMTAKALALLWCVEHTYPMDKSSEGPLVGFVLAFDFYVITRIVGMYSELVYIKQHHEELH